MSTLKYNIFTESLPKSLPKSVTVTGHFDSHPFIKMASLVSGLWAKAHLWQVASFSFGPPYSNMCFGHSGGVASLGTGLWAKAHLWQVASFSFGPPYSNMCFGHSGGVPSLGTGLWAKDHLWQVASFSFGPYSNMRLGGWLWQVASFSFGRVPKP